MRKKSLLDSGLTVVSEYRPGFPSLAISLTLKSGAARETPERNGVHHLIEHMMFKGSRHYSMLDIATMTDRLGGHLNAFTGREITQYYLKVLDEQAVPALDLLLDMVFRSTLPKKEVHREREVVLQEIREAEDSPETHAFENFFSRLYGNSGLGLPIAGTCESVSRLKRDFLMDWYTRNYNPANLMVTSVGNMEHVRLLDLVSRRIPDSDAASPSQVLPVPDGFRPGTSALPNPSLQQSYVIVAFPGLCASHPDRYAFSMVNDILGGGMSSRLFQSVREEHGIAYTVSSFHESFQSSGVHLLYAVMEPGQVMPYLEIVAGEIARLKAGGISADEMERARDHLKASLALGLEDNLNRMRFLVNRELFHIREAGVEDILARINEIQSDHLKQILDTNMLSEQAAVFVYGPGNNGKNSPPLFSELTGG